MSSKKKGRVINTLFYVIVFLMLFYIAINTFFPNESINYLGFKSYVVITPSMEPEINVNDLVVVVKVKVEDLEVGDIITFYTDLDDNGTNEVVTHYLFSITEDTEGDRIFKTISNGAMSPDPWVLKDDDIIGRISFTVPKVGVVLKVFTNPIMVILIVVNVSIVVAVVKVTKKALSETKKP